MVCSDDFQAIFNYLLSTNDAPCISELPLIRNQIEHSKTALGRLDAQIADIQTLLNTLVQQRQCIKERLSSFQCIIAPIRRVPHDVLIEIFLFTRDWSTAKHDVSIESRSVGPRPGRSPLQITHVCSEWRRVALSIPMLWTTITASHRNLGLDNRLVTWLARTGTTAPLDITFDGPPNYWSSNGKPASASLAWMSPYMHRIRNLSLSGRIADFPNDSLDHLETLKVTSLALGTHSSHDAAPSLRRVSFRGNFIRLKFIRWQQLTHLYFDVDRLRPSVLLGVLAQSMGLTSLVVRCIVDDSGFGAESDEDTSTNDEIINVSQLQTLSLGIGSKTTWLLEHLTLPALTSLCITGAEAWSSLAYNSFQSRSSFHLKSLTINHCNISEPLFIDLLRNTPTLTEILADVTIHLTPTLIDALTCSSKDRLSNLGPNLEHIGICDIISPHRGNMADNEAILRMIRSRDSSGKSAILASELWVLSHLRVFRSHHPKRPCGDEQTRGIEAAKEYLSGRENVEIFF